MKTKDTKTPLVVAPEIGTPIPTDEKMTSNMIDAFETAFKEPRACVARLAATLLDSGESAWALEWSASAFEAAAQIRVFGEVIRGLRSRKDDESYLVLLDRITAYCQDKIYLSARYPARSTNPTSDLMNREILAAWSRAVEIIAWNK
jgi:hypothetical protein